MRVRQLNTLLPIEVAVTGRAGPRACTAYGRQCTRSCACVQSVKTPILSSYLVVGLEEDDEIGQAAG